MENIGLVLEGGGMRGLYTAGVLEFFLERNMFFPYTIGVSAGACMAASYLSKQKGRNKKVNTGLVSDPRYLSYRNLFLRRELFGMDFLFDEIPKRIVPFDFETFLKAEEQFVVGTTNCRTGEATYFNKRDHGKDMLKIIRASSSLPFISSVVEYDQKYLLDGGLVDPIPVKQAQRDGFKRNIVVMTKVETYKKQPSKLATLATLFYRKHPAIAKLLKERHLVYNKTLMYIESERKKGNLFVIEPSMDLPVTRIERNQKRLLDLYELGYHDAKYKYNQLLNWFSK